MPIIINGTTFANGGTAIAGGTDLKQIDCLGTTVWKKEISLLTKQADADNWSFVTKDGDACYAEIKNSQLTVHAHYWTDGGRIAWAYTKLTECTSVSKIKFDYRNSTNPFAGYATYIGIVRRGSWHPYYGTGTNAGGSDRATSSGSWTSGDDAYLTPRRQVYFPAGGTSNPGENKHDSWTAYEFTFGSTPVDLSNYYLYFGVAVQANQTSGTIKANLYARNIVAV